MTRSAPWSYHPQPPRKGAPVPAVTDSAPGHPHHSSRCPSVSTRPQLADHGHTRELAICATCSMPDRGPVPSAGLRLMPASAGRDEDRYWPQPGLRTAFFRVRPESVVLGGSSTLPAAEQVAKLRETLVQFPPMRTGASSQGADSGTVKRNEEVPPGAVPLTSTFSPGPGIPVRIAVHPQCPG